MKIIVTDGATLNPGDLSWDGLKALGFCEIYEKSTSEQTIQRCREADIIVTNKVVFDRNTLKSLPKLKMISVTATGYNVVDIEAAKDYGVVVTNVPIYGTQSVAQMVFALLLELCHHTGYHSETVHQGKWTHCDNFCYWDKPLIELAGMTMGILGCGRIGQATARLAQAFGMKTIGYDIVSPPEDSGIHPVDLETIFPESDVISLHCPLTAENNGFIDKNYIAKMKSTAFLINTSRGQLINEKDLAEALNSEKNCRCRA